MACQGAFGFVAWVVFGVAAELESTSCGGDVVLGVDGVALAVALHAEVDCGAREVEVASVLDGEAAFGVVALDAVGADAGDGACDGAAREVGGVVGLDADRGVACDIEVDGAACHVDEGVGFESLGVVVFDVEVEGAAVDVGCAVVVAVDEVALYIGEGEGAAADFEVVVFWVAVAFSTVDAVADGTEDVDVACGFLQLEIFFGSKGMAGIACDVEHSAAFNFEVPLGIECAALVIKGIVGECVDGVFLQDEADAFAAVEV